MRANSGLKAQTKEWNEMTGVPGNCEAKSTRGVVITRGSPSTCGGDRVMVDGAKEFAFGGRGVG